MTPTRYAALREMPPGPRRYKDNVVLDTRGYVLAICPGPDGWRMARAIAHALDLAEARAAEENP